MSDAPLAPEAPPRDADQRFLRSLLDGHERLAAIVHERMMMRHDDHAMAPGMTMDPSRNTGGLDAAFDQERRGIAELLRRVYQDEHPPLLPAKEQRSADSLARNSEPAGDSAYRAQIIGGLRDQEALIRRSLPSVRRPEVRHLAETMARDARARVAMLQAGPAH